MQMDLHNSRATKPANLDACRYLAPLMLLCLSGCKMVVMSPTGDIAVAGTAFFTSDLGGSPMMYWNMVWMWGIRKSTC